MKTLEDIVAHKRKEVAEKCKTLSEADLWKQANAAKPPRGFAKALRQRMSSGEIALIAEIKRASPSKGLIRADFAPDQLALAYENGGASCLSVLTDQHYFQGHDSYLAVARNATQCPVLRKDFMIDRWQIVESRALGADCVLLLLACLSEATAQDMAALAHELGMDVLAEAHSIEETEQACRIGADLVGINNRNLKTMAVDLANGEAMLPIVRKHNPNVICVAESGLGAAADIVRMQQAGAEAFLIGESLMRQQDVETATQRLIARQDWTH